MVRCCCQKPSTQYAVTTAPSPSGARAAGSRWARAGLARAGLALDWRWARALRLRAPGAGGWVGTGRLYMCFVVKLHYVIVLCGAERVRTISHESLQCLCFERRSQSRCSQKLAQKTLLDGQNFWIGARPASGRGGSAHRLRSGLRPRAADRRPVLGIGAVPPPAAPAGCQSPVSGTGLETRRSVREAPSLQSRPHAMLLARNKHRTECLAIQR